MCFGGTNDAILSGIGSMLVCRQQRRKDVKLENYSRIITSAVIEGKLVMFISIHRIKVRSFSLLTLSPSTSSPEFMLFDSGNMKNCIMMVYSPKPVDRCSGTY